MALTLQTTKNFAMHHCKSIFYLSLQKESTYPLESKPLDLEVFDSKLHNPNLKVWIPINIS